jgi:hypothetical protein
MDTPVAAELANALRVTPPRLSQLPGRCRDDDGAAASEDPQVNPRFVTLLGSLLLSALTVARSAKIGRTLRRRRGLTEGLSLPKRGYPYHHGLDYVSA